MASFEHNGQQYMDCWIETTVKHRGGKNMDGLYIAGHYPDYDTAKSALEAIQAAHPKAYSTIILLPDTSWNRHPLNPCPGQ